MDPILNIIRIIFALLFPASILMFILSWIKPDIGVFWIKNRKDKQIFGSVVYVALFIISIVVCSMTSPTMTSVSQAKNFSSDVIEGYLKMEKIDDQDTPRQYDFDPNYTLGKSVIIDVDEKKLVYWDTIPMADKPSEVDTVIYLHYNYHRAGRYTDGFTGWSSSCSVNVLDYDSGKIVRYDVVRGHEPSSTKTRYGDLYADKPSDNDIQKFLKTLL